MRYFLLVILFSSVCLAQTPPFGFSTPDDDTISLDFESIWDSFHDATESVPDLNDPNDPNSTVSQPIDGQSSIGFFDDVRPEKKIDDSYTLEFDLPGGTPFSYTFKVQPEPDSHLATIQRLGRTFLIFVLCMLFVQKLWSFLRSW